MMKIEGSGSISHRHGSGDPDPDPDPHQNVMDPQHWLLQHFRKLVDESQTKLTLVVNNRPLNKDKNRVCFLETGSVP
jgi:hypothetical protein